MKKYTKKQIAAWYGKERRAVRESLRGATILFADPGRSKKAWPPIKRVVIFQRPVRSPWGGTDTEVLICDSDDWYVRDCYLSDVVKNNLTFNIVKLMSTS